MLRTKFDKLLFAVAGILCIAVAAVFIADRLKQRSPVGNFEIHSKSDSTDEELLLSAELPGRKESPTDDDATDKSEPTAPDHKGRNTESLSPSIITDIESEGAMPAYDGQSGIPAENDSNWVSCDLVRYTSMNTRLRSAASTEEGEVIDVLPLGEKINVTAQNDSWSQVLDSQGRKGYILSELLVKDEPAAANSVSVNRTRYSSGDLRLREKPGKDGAYMLTIPAGTKLTELTVLGSWSQVQMSDGLKGYVNNEYLTANRPPTNGTSAGTPEKTSKPVSTENSANAPTASKPADDGFVTDKKTLYATAALNVRSGPGTGYSKMGSVSKGTKVTQLSRKGSWSKIKLDDGSTGYVMSSYLSASKPVQETSPPAAKPTEGSGNTSESTTDIKIKLTADERRDTAALLYLEGGATSRACQKMITEVIFNQWKLRGGSLTDTLFAPSLFTVAHRIKSTAPKDLQYEIVDEVCRDGVSIPSDILYFRSNYYHSFGTPYTKIGNIYFSGK